MYSNILDTVRPADAHQLIMIESYLIRSALMGTPAVLSPNQAIDSAAIQLITEGNSLKVNNYFLKAVSMGIVRIAIPRNFRDITDYCLDTLKRGEKNPSDEFIFSSLKFLYEKNGEDYVYDYNARKEVLDYIYVKISEAKFITCSAVPPSWLSTENKECVQRFIDTIVQLGEAARIYSGIESKKHLLPVLIKDSLLNRLTAEETRSEMAELISVLLKSFENGAWPTYRSYYYRVCENLSGSFDKKLIAEAKEMIDICYNKIMADGLREKPELTIPTVFPKIAAHEVSSESNEKVMLSSAKMIENNTNVLDWESVIYIYSEIKERCDKSGKLWNEELENFYVRQSTLPLTLTGKFAIITAITIALSSVPLLNSFTEFGVNIISSAINDTAGSFISDFVNNAITDSVDGIFKKPTVSEIIKLSKQAKKNTEIIDIMVHNDYDISFYQRSNNG